MFSNLFSAFSLVKSNISVQNFYVKIDLHISVSGSLFILLKKNYLSISKLFN